MKRRIKSLSIKNKNLNSGMTLVEIILAMSILAIIVILMTPVMVSAFRMITISGNRQENAKDLAGNVENNLAGETVTASLEDISVDLPGGITVDGQKYKIDQGSDARFVDLWGYIISSMSVVAPTTTGTGTETSASETSATSSETSGTGVTLPTTTATEAPIVLDSVVADVSAWRTYNKHGTLYGTTTKMEYQILPLDGTPSTVWYACANSSTTLNFSTNLDGYQVVVRQITNTANNKHIRVRAAPDVKLMPASGANKYTFWVYDGTIGNYRIVTIADNIEISLTPNPEWNLVTDNKGTKITDLSYLYARYAAGASYNSGGITYDDPSSFPFKITQVG